MQKEGEPRPLPRPKTNETCKGQVAEQGGSGQDRGKPRPTRQLALKVGIVPASVGGADQATTIAVIGQDDPVVAKLPLQLLLKPAVVSTDQGNPVSASLFYSAIAGNGRAGVRLSNDVAPRSEAQRRPDSLVERNKGSTSCHFYCWFTKAEAV
jgi:hypothetical protein